LFYKLLERSDTMPHIHLLEQTFQHHVAWQKQRITLLAKWILALITAKTVNLVELASVMPGTAKQESSYKRLQRFLRFFEINDPAVARYVVGLLGLEPPWVLTLDRTEWHLGKLPLNMLTLGIAYKGVAFPLGWTILPKAGTSNTQERIALLERFRDLFGTPTIASRCADREFTGTAWLAYLLKHRMPFRLRIRKNTKVPAANGQPVQAWQLFAALPLGQPLLLEQPQTIWGHRLSRSGLRLPDGDDLLIVTPQFSATVLAEYARRWNIETLFGCLKRRGFRLEETHLTAPERLSKLLVVLTLAFCWAHAVGGWLAQQKPLKIKKHGRLAKRLFRYGFDHLRHLMITITDRLQNVHNVIRVLEDAQPSGDQQQDHPILPLAA
jgi:hypothetical protein